MPSRCNFLRLFSSTMFNTYFFFQQDMSIIVVFHQDDTFFPFFWHLFFFGSRCKHLGDTVDGSEIPRPTTWLLTKKPVVNHGIFYQLPTSTGESPDSFQQRIQLPAWKIWDPGWELRPLAFWEWEWFHSGIHLGILINPYKSLWWFMKTTRILFIAQVDFSGNDSNLGGGNSHI